MVKPFKSFRVSCAVLAACLLATATGCKQVSTWSNAAPYISSPSADPFGTPAEGYLHQPESSPSLDPVPALPAPGHTEPMDPSPLPPPPPPVPINGAKANGGAGDRVAIRPNTKWNLRPMGFFSRKSKQPDAVEAPADEATEAPEYELPSPAPSRLQSRMAIPLPLSDEGSGPFHTPELAAHPDQNLQASHPAVPAPPRNLTAPSASGLDESYTGPVITPGGQYTVGRDDPIENWPHSRTPVSARAPGSTQPVPMSAPEKASIDLPATPAVLSPLPVPVQAAPSGSQSSVPSPATVPLLLPPGL